MVVGFGGLWGLHAELYGLIGLARDSQRELAVRVAEAFDLLAEHDEPHVLGRAALAVAESTGERLHGLHHVEGDDGGRR